MLTNFFPRRTATRLAGWFSRIEQPLVRDCSIAIWHLFCDVDLEGSKKQKFASLHDCFVRELKEGVRPIASDPATIVSPCDGTVVACGSVEHGELLQVKGSSYPLADLLGDAALAASYHDGSYVTLRLTAGMYHRFHAPQDCRVEAVTHFWGDVWNVNPATLRRVSGAYCRNERVVIQTAAAPGGERMALVAVAAVLVAGIKLRFLDLVFTPRQARKPIEVPTDNYFCKGQEMGWFEHGSTIILLASAGTSVLREVRPGATMRMGQPLMQHGDYHASSTAAHQVIELSRGEAAGQGIE